MAAMGGGAGAAGQAVTEVTGEPLFGVATSMTVPGLAIALRALGRPTCKPSSNATQCVI